MSENNSAPIENSASKELLKEIQGRPDRNSGLPFFMFFDKVAKNDIATILNRHNEKDDSSLNLVSQLLQKIHNSALQYTVGLQDFDDKDDYNNLIKLCKTLDVSKPFSKGYYYQIGDLSLLYDKYHTITSGEKQAQPNIALSIIKEGFQFNNIILAAMIAAISFMATQVLTFPTTYVAKDNFSVVIEKGIKEIFSKESTVPTSIEKWAGNIFNDKTQKASTKIEERFDRVTKDINNLDNQFQNLLRFESLRTTPNSYLVGQRLKLYTKIGKTHFQNINNNETISYYGNEFIPVYLNVGKKYHSFSRPKKKYISRKLEGRIIYLKSLENSFKFQEGIIQKVLYDKTSPVIATISSASFEKLAGRKIKANEWTHPIEINFICDDTIFDYLTNR